MINAQQQYFSPDGRPTVAGLQLLGDQARRIAALEAGLASAISDLSAAEAKLAAIAAVAPPAGVTVDEDAEARTAIGGIISAAS